MNKVVKILSLIFFLALPAGAAFAQNTEVFRRSLAVPDSLTGGSVRVHEHGTAAEIVSAFSAPADQTISVYRVRIFFDKSQTAREDAIAVQSAFRSQFPDVPSYLDYIAPAFRVTVGNCITMEEALILQNKVKRHFSTAFMWSGEIPVAEFLKYGDPSPVTAPAAENRTDDTGTDIIPGGEY